MGPSIEARRAEPSSTTQGPGARLQRACACGQHAEGGECAECRRMREGTLQRSALSAASVGATAPTIVHEVLRSSGRPLDAATRAVMEPRFDRDFSGVRIHDDTRAAESARAVNARAYAVGEHVAFGAGHYQPHSSAGAQLLAHELAHVALTHPDAFSVAPNASLPVADEDSAGERAARALSQGNSPFSLGDERPAVRRSAMTEEDIRNRMEELNAVINDQSFSAAERQEAAAELAQFSKTLKGDTTAKGPSTVTSVAPAKAKAPRVQQIQVRELLPSATAGPQELARVMEVIDGIRPSNFVSGLFNLSYQGRTTALTAQQVDFVREAARRALKSSLSGSLSRLSAALGRYRSQEQVNDEFPLASGAAKAYAWISTFGRYENPEASVYGQVAIATVNVNRASAALRQDKFAEAMRFALEADAASERTSKIVHAYIDQLISGGEDLVTGLTFTRNAAFITVGALAVVVSGGAALGLSPGVVGTGIGGLTVAQTATVITVVAPTVANLGVAGAKLADGDPVDWTELAVDTAVQIVLARFGGRLSAGIAGKLAGNPAAQTAARNALANLAGGAATHVVSQTFSTTASAGHRSLRGRKVTRAEYVDALAASLSDPTGWMMVVMGSGVQTVAQTKVANAAREQGTDNQSPPAKTPPAQPTAPPPTKSESQPASTTAAKPTNTATKDGGESLGRTYYGGGEDGRKGMRTGKMPPVEEAPPTRTAKPPMGLTASERAMVSDALRAQERLGKPLAVKTKAAADEGNVRRSGYGARGSGEKRTQDVLDVGKEIKHKFAENASVDGGVPGKAAASHAEKLVAIENPGKPLAVDRVMCLDCFAFFQKLAVVRKTDLVVQEPGNTWVFRSDGVRVGLSAGSQVVLYPDGRASASPAP